MGKIMVCGGAGFIGSHLVDRLIDLHHNVCVVDNLSSGKKEYINVHAKFYKVDVCDFQVMRKIFEIEKPEFLFYEASRVCWDLSEKNFYDDIKINILGILNTLNCCVDFSVKKIIYGSSIAVYGSAKSKIVSEKEQINLDRMPMLLYSYAITKYVGELYTVYYNRKYGLTHTILRYSHVYGPRQTSKEEVISKFAQKFITGETVIIYGNGRQGRDYVYIDDVIDATILALKKGNSQAINIGSGKLTTVNDLFNTYAIIFHSKKKPNHVATRKDEPKSLFMDIRKAKRTLAWMPKTTLKDGIENTLLFFKNTYRSG